MTGLPLDEPSERSRGVRQNTQPSPLEPNKNEGSIATQAAEVFERWPEIRSAARERFSEMLQERDEHGQAVHTRESLSTDNEFHAFVNDLQRNNPQLRVPDHQMSELVRFLRMELLGLGSMDLYLSNPGIEDIFLDRWDTMDVILDGKKVRLSETPFASDREVFDWLQAKVFSPVNKEFNRSNPSENAMLLDGSRLIAVTQPISPFTSFSIRRHKKEVFQTVEAYMSTQVAPPEFFQDLDSWVKQYRNLVLAGATGSGKTTLVNVAASLIPHDERLITLEDTPELQIQHPRVKPLYTYEKGARAGDSGGSSVPMSDLLRYALRMKPDRIIVGEVRDRETFDMLDALNTGHAGSFTTLHSNSPIDALTRLQMMSSRHPSSGNLDQSTIQDLIASVVDVIAQIKNLDGQRRVFAVEQVLYAPHYAEQPEALKDGSVRQIYPNLYLRTLWRWDHQTQMLQRVNQYLVPDHG